MSHQDNPEILGEKIIGLGETSMRKNYYPELQRKLLDLQRFKSLTDSINDVLMIFSVEDLVTIDINKYTERVFSIKYEDIVGKSLYEYSQTGFFKFLYENINALLNKILQSDSMVIYYYADDKTLSLEINLKTVNFVDVNYLLLIGRNITQRVKAIRALQESERMYKELVESMPMIFFEIDLDFKIKFTNKYGLQKLGYNLNDLVKINAFDLIVPEEHEKVKINIQRKLNGEMVTPTEYTIKKSDGVLMPVIIESSAVIKDGKVTGLRGFIMDISDRKQLEYERQRISKLDSLSLLTAGIAHDFNNILTVIIGNISLASMIIDGEDKAYKYLQKASNAVNMAKDLTEKLLLFSKGIEPNKKIISTEKIIRETVDLCLYNKTTKCIIDIPEDLVNIDADSVQIGQVFQNLIINAEQAMPKGGTIKITGKNIDLSENNIYNLPKGKYVEITVSDEGIGISKENLQRIFEPYFTTKDKGNGLGLATAYGIIKKHGGFINVTSVVGVGTTFVIYLPSSMS